MGLIFIFLQKEIMVEEKIHRIHNQYIISLSSKQCYESPTGLLGNNTHICDLVLCKHGFFIGNFVPDKLLILCTSSSTLLDGVLENSQDKHKIYFSNGNGLAFIFITMTETSWLNHGLLPSLLLGLGQGTNVISQGCCRDRLPVASRKYVMIQKGTREMTDPCREQLQ